MYSVPLMEDGITPVGDLQTNWIKKSNTTTQLNMNISDTGTRQLMGGLGGRGENTQGLRVSDTDTRQYLGGFGQTHESGECTRVI